MEGGEYNRITCFTSSPLCPGKATGWVVTRASSTVVPARSLQALPQSEGASQCPQLAQGCQPEMPFSGQASRPDYWGCKNVKTTFSHLVRLWRKRSAQGCSPLDPLRVQEIGTVYPLCPRLCGPSAPSEQTKALPSGSLPVGGGRRTREVLKSALEHVGIEGNGANRRVEQVGTLWRR